VSSPDLDWVSVKTSNHRSGASVDPLLQAIVAMFTQRLQVRWVVEEIKVAFVRGNMVNHLSGCDIFSDKAEPAQWFGCELIISQPFPSGEFV
jgi:hypothetical protein